MPTAVIVMGKVEGHSRPQVVQRAARRSADLRSGDIRPRRAHEERARLKDAVDRAYLEKYNTPTATRGRFRLRSVTSVWSAPVVAPHPTDDLVR